MGSTTIQPGGETTIGYSMMMHPGMEGPHLFQLTLPVRSSVGETSELQLYVRAHFGS